VSLTVEGTTVNTSGSERGMWSFECMDLILSSGTLKNFRFLLRSCLFTDRPPVIKSICSTLQPWHCIDSLMTLRRDVYWSSDVYFDLMRYRSQTSDILLCSRTFETPSLILLSSTYVRGRVISRDRVVFHIVSCVRFKYCIHSISDGM
jgi:hypothetical protein